MFDFKNLAVYEKGKTLQKAIILTGNQIKMDRFFSDQLKRAALSVPLNIAEGAGRFSRREKRSFYINARASIFECAAIFDILDDHFSESQRKELDILTYNMEELSKMLFAMIRNLEAKP